MTRGNSELLCTVGKVPGLARKIAIIAVYIPPQTRTPKCDEIMQHIANEICKLKQDYEDSYIMIAGDFNKKNTKKAFENYLDINELEAGPTQKNEALDLVFSNFKEHVVQKKVVAPLETEQGLKSDHNTIYAEAALPASDSFSWKYITTRPKTKSGDAVFASLLCRQS